ncbi:MAG: BlaI/MecI/CopY family transcriptional regulator [ANME-2 cluster archaeon]|nr:BlaI/MecI/CopY family transcriptional regulator [ANME-2 cluster archaeon]
MVRINHINLEKRGLLKFISPYEAEILQILWEERNLNSTQIQQYLLKNNRALKIATVSGLLARLEEAGYVTRETVKIDSKLRYVYSPIAGEKDMAELISHGIMEHLEEAFGSDFHEFIRTYLDNPLKENPAIGRIY